MTTNEVASDTRGGSAAQTLRTGPMPPVDWGFLTLRDRPSQGTDIALYLSCEYPAPTVADLQARVAAFMSAVPRFEPGRFRLNGWLWLEEISELEKPPD